MNTILLYIVFVLPGSAWHGSMELHVTNDLDRCIAVASMLQQASGKRHVCETIIKP